MQCPRAKPNSLLIGFTRPRLPNFTVPTGGHTFHPFCCWRNQLRAPGGTSSLALSLIIRVLAGSYRVHEAKPNGLGAPAKRRLGGVSSLVIEVVNEIAKTVAIQETQEFAESLLLPRPAMVLKDELAHVSKLAARFQLLEHRQLLTFDIQFEKVDWTIDVF